MTAEREIARIGISSVGAKPKAEGQGALTRSRRCGGGLAPAIHRLSGKLLLETGVLIKGLKGKKAACGQGQLLE